MTDKSVSDSAASGTATAKTPTESDVYDRQIRLWGAQAQADMNKANVLYIHITAVSSEILKNLVLAGVRATLYDSRPYPEAVSESPSLLVSSPLLVGEPDAKKQKTEESNDGDTSKTVAEALRPVVEDMNPLLGACQVIASDKKASELTAEDLQGFSVVVASKISSGDALRISDIVTNQHGAKFYLVDTFGWDGACVMDFGSTKDLEYRPEQGKTVLDPTNLEGSTVPLSELMSFPLAKAVNRFHKTPPKVLVQYKCLLDYQQHKTESADSMIVSKMWPTTELADDFVSFVKDTWIPAQEFDGALPDCLSDDALRDLARVATSELAPVASVLGGLVGNEVLKVITKKGEPAYNTLLFDGSTSKAWSFRVPPKAKK